MSRPCSLSRWLILSSLVWLLGALPAGAASRPAAAEAPVPATPWALVVQGDRLTVELHGVPLGEVLAELARQANLHVTFSEATGHELVSASFRHVPLDQAIGRLLGTRSYALVYAPTASGPSARERRRISELMVLSGTDLRADREEARPAKPTQAELLGPPDPQVRLTALEQWAAQGPEAAIHALSQALVDPDEHVRARAQALWEEALARQAGEGATTPAEAETR